MTLPWIRRAPAAPYFIDETGRDWTPIGQNDAIAWHELAGLLHRRDLPAVERHFTMLADNGVTVLRLMLEYAQDGQFFFEQPAGTFNPVIVGLWDDLFRLAEQAGLRLLLTPLDTFFQWVRWDLHPYNTANGGPCSARTRLMVCPGARALIKGRLAFATRRWGGSGALFAWDLWNEMHPVQGEDRPDCFTDYIDDVGPFLRQLETELHGRPHLQCVSVFGPELRWKPWLNAAIFRHPALDFASSHFYAEGTIDSPRDTVAPALAVAALMREALDQITDARPFLDSEHGPIHSFKDHGVTLPEAFDDEYFRHIQWTHLACGGAGGGMRWPNRHPHSLTPGMRRAQRSLARFSARVDWASFDRILLGAGLAASDPDLHVFGCGNARQAVLYALRGSPLTAAGLNAATTTFNATIQVPGLRLDGLDAFIWDPVAECEVKGAELHKTTVGVQLHLPIFGSEIAVVLRRSR